MAYTAVPTVATGDTWTATQHNTYLRDNMSAIWAGTAAGEMDYYTSATTKSNISAPASYALLSHNGSTPSWAAAVGMSSRAYRSSDATWATNVTIQWNANTQDTTWHSTSTNADRITVDSTGIYLVSSAAYILTPVGGGASYSITLLVNGSTTVATAKVTVAASAYAELIIPALRLSLSAGDYLTIRQFDAPLSGSTSLLQNSFFNVVKIK